MFPTQYDKGDRKEVFTHAGQRMKVKYRAEIDDDGNLELVPDGSTDVYEAIQSHAASVDINVILGRYVNGESYLLEQRDLAYLDTTQMPQSYAEMLNLINRAKSDFEALPLDQRAAFDHSFEKYMASAGSSEWLAALGFVQSDKVSAPAAVEGVSENAE